MNITQELEILNDWFSANMLSLNVAKTQYMLFSNTKSYALILPKIKIGNKIVMKTSCLNLLGLTIDDQLKWDKHIDIISKKVTSGRYALHRAKHVLNRKHLIILYYALLYPYMLYGITLWGNTYNVYTNKLIILQKKIVRIISSSDYMAHTEPILKSLNLLKLTDVYNMQVAKFVFKHVTGCLSPSLNNIFTETGNINLYATRQVIGHKLIVPKVRTSLSAKCITTMGPKIWNIIPVNLYQYEIRGINQFVSMKCFVSRYESVLP